MVPQLAFCGSVSKERAMRRKKYSCDIMKTSKKILLYVSIKDNFRSVCMKQSQKLILDLHNHFGMLECIIQRVWWERSLYESF